MLVPMTTESKLAARNYAAGKTKMAAWFVSNCNTLSGRETSESRNILQCPINCYQM